MAFRGGQNRNRNFGGGNYGGNRGGMNPWDGQGGNYGGGMGGRQGGGQGMNAEALSLANNLLNNLLRNPNPPSLLDLPRGGGGMGGNRNRQMGNRAGGGGNGNNRYNNRRQGGNRGNQKPGNNKQSSGGVRNKHNALDRAKKLLAKNSNKKKDSASGDNSKVTESPSLYTDVPNDMFYCHLCKKHMWDAVSFENHIKGRTHLMMREGIEESYRLKANMIRQEAKIAETLRSIELDRLKRMGKPGKRGTMEYCTMCDLSFHGHLSTHRKSEGHLHLKDFLHPKCVECSNEFPTRIEYDTHLLSADHLIKAAEKNIKVGDGKVLQTLKILTEKDELKDVRPPQKRKKVVVKAEGEKKEGEAAEGEKKENGEATEGDAVVKKEEVAEEEGDHDETKEGDETVEEVKEGDEWEEVPLPVDPEDCIVDFEEGTDIPVEVDARLPKYNWTRPVGSKLIQSLACVECRLCGRFFDNDKTAEIHTRTAYHHRNFVKFISEKSSDSKIAQKRAAAAAEEVERKKKRLEEAAAATEKSATDGETPAEGGDLYDPSEATGDDEDVEMTANGEKNGEANISAKESANESTEKMEEEATPVKAEVKEEAAEEPHAPEPPVISETPTPAATPAKKGAAAKTSTPRNTPARNRGRGRYNRY